MMIDQDKMGRAVEQLAAVVCAQEHVARSRLELSSAERHLKALAERAVGRLEGAGLPLGESVVAHGTTWWVQFYGPVGNVLESRPCRWAGTEGDGLDWDLDPYRLRIDGDDAAPAMAEALAS
jgi:hypothetical protein